MLRNRLRSLLDRWVVLANRDSAVRQAGAIPYTIVDGQVVFLLVTSRRSGRWIFPKGVLTENMTPWALAAKEAFEEAGVRGEVDPKPIGSYRTMKTLSIRRQPIIVDLYPLRVQEQLDEWPEKGQRHRHWAILPEAKRLLSDSKLANLTVRLSKSLAGPQPATALMK